MRSRLVRILPIAGAAVAALLAVIVLGGSDGGYTIRVELADAAGLRERSHVKVNGVPVGEVSSLEVTDRDTALATLALDSGAGPPGRGAAARVRSANLLGEKYLDLDPGDPRRPLRPGDAIPMSRTGAPVELDDLLNVLDDRTRSLLSVLINESGIALSGRGSDFNRMLTQLPPTLDRSRELLAAFGADNRALGRLVEQSDRILAAIAQERRALGHWIGSAEGALRTAASRRQELGETIRQAPATISQLRRSLTHLEDAGATLGPSAAALRAAAPALTRLLREVPPFTAAANPTLREARDVAPTLVKLGREATPVVGRLGPMVRDVTSFAGALDPASRTLDRSIDDALGTLEGWARATQVRDAAGHMFRGDMSMSDELVRTLVDRYLRPPGERAPSRPTREAARSTPMKAPAPAPSPERQRLEAPPLRHGLDRLLTRLEGWIPQAPRQVPRRTELLLDYLLGP